MRIPRSLNQLLRRHDKIVRQNNKSNGFFYATFSDSIVEDAGCMKCGYLEFCHRYMSPKGPLRNEDRETLKLKFNKAKLEALIEN